MMSQQKSGSFRQREAERLRRFIAARQSSGGLGQDGAAPLDPVDPIRATEEADPVANLPSRAEPAEAHQHEQVDCAAPCMSVQQLLRMHVILIIMLLVEELRQQIGLNALNTPEGCLLHYHAQQPAFHHLLSYF